MHCVIVYAGGRAKDARKGNTRYTPTINENDPIFTFNNFEYVARFLRRINTDSFDSVSFASRIEI